MLCGDREFGVGAKLGILVKTSTILINQVWSRVIPTPKIPQAKCLLGFLLSVLAWIKVVLVLFFNKIIT